MHIQYWQNISIWVKVSQVSDVAHGPLVFVIFRFHFNFYATFRLPFIFYAIFPYPFIFYAIFRYPFIFLRNIPFSLQFFVTFRYPFIFYVTFCYPFISYAIFRFPFNFYVTFRYPFIFYAIFRFPFIFYVTFRLPFSHRRREPPCVSVEPSHRLQTERRPARSHGQCHTGPVHQEPRSAHQLLQGQSPEDLGRPATSLYPAAGRDVP
jgi:hypothetical protein